MNENYFDTMAKAYALRCNIALKKFDREKAKRNFEKAWEAMNTYGCTKETESMIYILRENFYPTGSGIFFSEKGTYYEGKILARQNEEF